MKSASTDYPILPLLKERWSPCAFDDRVVSKKDLCSLFEAARWAPSSYNEQPWSYIVATKEEPQEYHKILSCLVEENQAWAKTAPVLVLCVVHLKFVRNGEPNKEAAHDLGLSTENLIIEAMARNLFVHQMVGIYPDKARELYKVPMGFDILAAMAIGYCGDPENLSEGLKKRDLAPRKRKPLPEFVFSGTWKNPW